MHLFYAPDIEKTMCLLENESNHAVKVLRLTAGDDIIILNGQGTIYKATIAVAHPKHCVVNALTANRVKSPRDYYLHIAIAPTKNMDRLEWFVEKAVEIGIDEISPIFCRFSERKVLNNSRLEKILVSAMKQSMQPFITKLNTPRQLSDLLKAAEADQKFVAHCHEADKQLLSKTVEKSKSALILIGPEGDFSEEELALALSLGYKAVSLGETRLRVETAALVACHTVGLINEL